MNYLMIISRLLSPKNTKKMNYEDKKRGKIYGHTP